MLIYNKSLDNVNTPIRTFLYYALLIQCFKSLNILFSSVHVEAVELHEFLLSTIYTSRWQIFIVFQVDSYFPFFHAKINLIMSFCLRHKGFYHLLGLYNLWLYAPFCILKISSKRNIMSKRQYMKEKYHTVRTIPKSNWKITVRNFWEIKYIC